MTARAPLLCSIELTASGRWKTSCPQGPWTLQCRAHGVGIEPNLPRRAEGAQRPGVQGPGRWEAPQEAPTRSLLPHSGNPPGTATGSLSFTLRGLTLCPPFPGRREEVSLLGRRAPLSASWSWTVSFLWGWQGGQVLCSIFHAVLPLVKNPPAMRETWVQSLGWEDPLEKAQATHSSILA